VFNKAALRADRLGEILTQVPVPKAFFAALLNLQPGRRRFTLELISAAFDYAGAVGQRFKHHFRVLRPADRSPLVQPLLLTPGHSSYPAGHATQGHLVKKVLASLIPEAAGNAAWAVGNETYDQLEGLANRIAENRIVAGLHYPVDNSEGKTLGESLATDFIEKAKTAGSALNWLWGKASDEWR
jgi:membrane-associated phospholipid phosphatase